MNMEGPNIIRRLLGDDTPEKDSEKNKSVQEEELSEGGQKVRELLDQKSDNDKEGGGTEEKPPEEDEEPFDALFPESVNPEKNKKEDNIEDLFD